ncbi:calcium/proton exchanger [Sphingomonas sp. CROZ-RG-20F-R02-07]|uniref:calcium/proton exchanger n=1 Tax=Sphingomonas sp. CROZ-RG-20F-R02-07 TaxID=2914832 RepID=UPI001F592112|nr:calcium/proton exchanger [Sphingomonas sp. CROZ-RG-20F-R02-07]
MTMILLTLIVPLLALLRYGLHAPALVIFAVGGVAVAILAEWMRRATEHIASRAGSAIGGLLTVSFGSAAELILALFVIASGHGEIVRAQITGSIIGTSLLGLGLAALIGGWAREQQTFSRDKAGLLSTLFLLVVVALLLPAVFDHADLARGAGRAVRLAGEQALSIGVSIVLLLLYAGNLVFTLVTHRDVFASARDEPRTDSWGLPRSIAVLIAATAAVAFCAETVSGVLQDAAGTLGLPLLFVGVIPLALVGTAADLFAAVSFARKDRMDLVMSICVGSSIQVGLVVAPLLVLISWAMGTPLSLVFTSLLDLFAIAAAAFVARSIAADGETNWFEGLLLIGVYALFALSFFFIAPVL